MFLVHPSVIIVPLPQLGKSLLEPVLLHHGVLLFVYRSLLQGHFLGLLLASQGLLRSARVLIFLNLKGKVSLSLFPLQGPFYPHPILKAKMFLELSIFICTVLICLTFSSDALLA